MNARELLRIVERTWRELAGGDLTGDGPGTHAAEHAQHIQGWRAQR